MVKAKSRVKLKLRVVKPKLRVAMEFKGGEGEIEGVEVLFIFVSLQPT